MSEFPISIDLSVGSSESITDSLMSFLSKLDEEQVRKAIAQFVILFQQKPGLGAVVYQQLAAYYHKQKQLNLAIDLYGYSIQLNNKFELSYYELGNLYVQLQKGEEGVSLEDSREGDWTIRKFEILQDYHFNLCLENTIAPYYCTEKIWDAIITGCLPIYYGGKNSTIYEDFPPNSFIDYCEFNSPIELFNYIDQMEFTEYEKRMNLCIDTFNKMGKIMKENQYFLRQRTERLIEKIITIFA